MNYLTPEFIEDLESSKDEVVENIKLYKKIDIYTKINKANLGSKVYLVAKTENFRNGESVKFKIFENGDKLLSDYVNEEEQLPFLLGTNERTEVVGIVVTDDVDNPETGNIKEGVVAVEIALRPKKDKPDNDTDTSANLEDWKKKFKKAETDTEDKEDKLYLKVSTTSYPEVEEEEFLVGDELVVKLCNCGTIYDKEVGCTRYNKVYGPIYRGSQKLKDYAYWDELVNDNKVTIEEKEILVAMSANEGNLDSVQSYDSEILTVGAMQKTINPKGAGEFAKQVSEFKELNPLKYKELFEDCGWIVENNMMYFKEPCNQESKKITGEKLKKYLRKGFTLSTYGNKVESNPVGIIVRASKDKDFQAKQVTDFINRLTNIVLPIKPVGYAYSLSAYLQSKLGKATVLDQHINRPAYVDDDFGKALDKFFKKNPTVDRNPNNWGANHYMYEKTILDDYGKKRRGTKMSDRYDDLKEAFE